jgi:hypothetical protein
MYLASGSNVECFEVLTFTSSLVSFFNRLRVQVRTCVHTYAHKTQKNARTRIAHGVRSLQHVEPTVQSRGPMH